MSNRLTLAGLVDERWSALGEKPYALYDDVPVTWGDLRRRSIRVANVLNGRGLEPGDVVGIYLNNCPEIMDILVAASRLGVLAVPINTAQVGDFLSHQVNEAGFELVITEPALFPRLEQIQDDVPGLQDVLVARAEGLVDLPGLRSRYNVADVSVLYEGTESHLETDHQPDPGDPLAILFTSGTTGKSKGVVVSNHYFVNGARVIAENNEMLRTDVWYGAVPLFHFSGLLGVLGCAMWVGCTAILDSWFSLTGTWDQVRKYNCTGMILVGPMLNMVWDLPEDPSDADLPIRVLGAAPIPPGWIEPIQERYNCRLVTMYGMTECFPISVHNLNDVMKPGTAGKPNSSFDVQIVDDHDQAVAPGEVGEIVARPKEPNVMFEGYFNRPEETLERMRTLWFHTGDYGRIDEDGYVTFVDRKKDALRRRGENMSSMEVEAALIGHRAIADAAVVAVPSPLGEDDVKACLVRTDDSVTHEELIRYCEEHIPFFAIPRYIEFVDHLPRNAVGRVLKFTLREEGINDATWDRDEAGIKIKKLKPTRH